MKMKDWKAAVRTWEKNSYNQPTTKNNITYQEEFTPEKGKFK